MNVLRLSTPSLILLVNFRAFALIAGCRSTKALQKPFSLDEGYRQLLIPHGGLIAVVKKWRLIHPPLLLSSVSLFRW
ncbi:hypothetical protein DVK00_20165 [Haloarcula sp. Atlit-47R]|nr:hypothetical protein DVK00_20165 [Haloarcula sp. Atlit-47R]